MDNGELRFNSNPAKDIIFYVGTTNELGFRTQYSGSSQGIYPGTEMTSEYTISGIGIYNKTINTSMIGTYEFKQTYFTPYEASTHTVSYVKKDMNGILLAQSQITINVILDESKLLDLAGYRDNVILDKYQYTYTGKENKPSITQGAITTVNKDYYTITYENNVEPGTAYMVLTGRYGAKGTIRIPFYIEKLTTTLSGKTKYTKAYGDKNFTLDMKANANQDVAVLIFQHESRYRVQ